MSRNSLQANLHINKAVHNLQGHKTLLQSVYLNQKPFVLLLILYFLMRLPFLFTVPTNEAPDEYAHLWVIKFLHDNLRLPNADEVLGGGQAAVYGSLPQFGYLPHILISWFFPDTWLPLSARLGSLLTGIITLYTSWRIGLLLFPGSTFLATSVPTLIACHPQLAFLHAYANNDSTACAIASVVLWLALRALREGVNLKHSMFIGALLGWLTLTKYGGLAIVPSVSVAMFAAGWLGKASLSYTLSSYSVALTLAAIIPCVWFARNSVEFNGDFMGTKTMYHTWATTFHRDLSYYLPIGKVIGELRWWRMTFFSYWGLFGYMNKYLWRPVYIVYFLSLLAGIVSFLVRIFSCRLKSNPLTYCMWLTIVLAPISNLIAMIWASTHNLGGPQGRYLFISEIPIAALFVGGLSLCGSERVSKVVLTVFLAFNGITCLLSFVYLFICYGGFQFNLQL